MSSEPIDFSSLYDQLAEGVGWAERVGSSVRSNGGESSNHSQISSTLMHLVAPDVLHFSNAPVNTNGSSIIDEYSDVFKF